MLMTIYERDVFYIYIPSLVSLKLYVYCLILERKQNGKRRSLEYVASACSSWFLMKGAPLGHPLLIENETSIKCEIICNFKILDHCHLFHKLWNSYQYLIHYQIEDYLLIKWSYIPPFHDVDFEN